MAMTGPGSRLGMAAGLCLGALPVLAEPVACPGGDVLTVSAEEDHALICDIAGRASRDLASCHLTVPEPVTIAVIPELSDHCLGLYHCGQNLIEILAPEAYAAMQEDGETRAFAGLSPEALFDSVIRHELAHAALDTMPCPFEACPVGQEYVGYTMQIMFLPDEDRAIFEAMNAQDRPVTPDMFNPIMLMMAPDNFAGRAWHDLRTRPDPCGYIRQIAEGETLLDFMVP